jgi:parvulin-like peptidyl-prolyl isomerase
MGDGLQLPSQPCAPQVFRHRYAAVCCAFLVFFCVFLQYSALLEAEIIDKILAVVDNRIITLSDIREERLIRAALGEQAPQDNSALLEELIERSLIVSQMAEFPGVEVTDEEVQEKMRNITVPDSVSDKAMKQAVRVRLMIARFMDARFRQFIRVTEDDVRKYYDEVFVPAARARGASVPPLEEVAEGIRANVAEEKLDDDVDVWLQALRRRSNIEIF